MSKTEEEPFVNENGLPLLSSLFHLPFVAINNIYLTFTKHLFYTHKTAKKRQSQDIYLIFTRHLFNIHKTAQQFIQKTITRHSQNCRKRHSQSCKKASANLKERKVQMFFRILTHLQNCLSHTFLR